MRAHHRMRSWHPEKKFMLYDMDQNVASIFPDMMIGDYIHDKVYRVGLYHGTLMLCSGLKDKNDKYIYEGDIIKYEEDEIRVINFPSWFACDDFEVYGYNELSGDWYGKPLGNKTLSKIEVIGNIYENPELLEKKE